MVKTRGTSMIGCNIRPGFTPGGFTGAGPRKGRREKKASMATVQAAAKTFMQERGLDEPVANAGFLFGAQLPKEP